MKTIEELHRYYQTDLLPELTILENVRKKVARNITSVIVIFSILAIIPVFLLFTMQNQLFMISLFLMGIVVFLLYQHFTKDYVEKFKIGIINEIVRFIEPNLTYTKDKCISEWTYLESKIFPQMPDRFRGEDYVSGMVGKTEIAFSEVHAEYKTASSDSKGRRQEQWHTIFKGIFFIADFHKDFSGETVVLPDTAEKLFGSVLGSLLQSWNVKRDQLIKLEDPDFEKLFVVYGSDQIEARYILSTSLMKRITDFKKKTGEQIYLSFVRGRVYVAISRSENLFEPRVFKTLLDFSPIQKYFEDLELAIGIVDELNLNTRIWSKQ